MTKKRNNKVGTKSSKRIRLHGGVGSENGHPSVHLPSEITTIIANHTTKFNTLVKFIAATRGNNIHDFKYIVREYVKTHDNFLQQTSSGHVIKELSTDASVSDKQLYNIVIFITMIESYSLYKLAPLFTKETLLNLFQDEDDTRITDKVNLILYLIDPTIYNKSWRMAFNKDTSIMLHTIIMFAVELNNQDYDKFILNLSSGTTPSGKLFKIGKKSCNLLTKLIEFIQLNNRNYSDNYNHDSKLKFASTFEIQYENYAEICKSILEYK